MSYLFKTKLILRKKLPIITVSEFSKKQLIKKYHIDSNRIIVIYNSWEHLKSINPNFNILDELEIKKQSFYE